MDDDHRELTNRLFATATAMVEDVTGIAVAGQSSRLEPSQLAGIARQFKAAAHDITTIAEAAAIVAALERQAPETGAKSRC